MSRIPEISALTPDEEDLEAIDTQDEAIGSGDDVVPVEDDATQEHEDEDHAQTRVEAGMRS